MVVDVEADVARRSEGAADHRTLHKEKVAGGVVALHGEYLLEGTDLEHHAHGGGHYIAAHEQEEEDMPGIDDHGADRSAQSHGAGIAHEYLRGVAVLRKEAHAAACDGES